MKTLTSLPRRLRGLNQIAHLEVPTWDIVTWAVALWKIPLGKYLTPFFVTLVSLTHRGLHSGDISPKGLLQ